VAIMAGDSVLDVVECLLKAAQHPDMTAFSRFGASYTGLAITYASQAHAYISIEPAKVQTRAAHLPEVMPDYKTRATHLLALLVDLFETVQPAGWRWRLVEVEGVHLVPSGIEVNANGAVTLLRVTAGGAPGEDTDPATFADWRIPDLAL
jgi:hypothetical protein